MTANANDDAGLHLQKASTFLLAGTIAELAGGAAIALTVNVKPQTYYNDDKDKKNGIYAGCAIAGAGLIMQIIGLIQLNKAGQTMRSQSVQFNENGVSVSFRLGKK